MAFDTETIEILDGKRPGGPLGIVSQDKLFGTALEARFVALEGEVDGVLTTDTISEATAANGVAVDGLSIKDGSVRPAVVTDPGASGAIPVTHSGVCPITTAGSETRTLAIPTFLGQWLVLVIDVDGGTCVITSAQAINQTGNNTITMAEVADTISLVAVQIAGVLRWRVQANDGAALTTV